MSCLMKILEWLVLAHLQHLVILQLDPLQIIYQPGIVVDDSIIHLLHRSLAHLVNAGSTVRSMFLDFSSAFDTMILKDMMDCTGEDHRISTWILDYYTNRPQHVRSRDCVSDRVLFYRSSSGNRTGTVSFHHLQTQTSPTTLLTAIYRSSLTTRQ